jgi:two-component system, NarL family, invasion response regulator UvrY
MKFLIADDHSIVRKGLIQLLTEEFPDSEVIEVINGSEAWKVAKSQIVDLILMDISMPGRNGIETVKQMRADGIKAPILVISMHPEEQYAIRAFKAGALGYVNKETATEELLGAIHKILAGRKYITPSVAEKLTDSLSDQSDQPAFQLLSDREMQVLQLIASGKTVSEIAEEISLSVNTISTYRTRILEKLSLANNAELTRYALDNELV